MLLKKCPPSFDTNTLSYKSFKRKCNTVKGNQAKDLEHDYEAIIEIL